MAILSSGGTIIFANNSGENGGAINLLNVRLFFLSDSFISFVANRASRFDGAIYTEGYQKRITIYNAFQMNQQIWKYCAILKNNGSVTFQDNRAQLAGDAIYETPIYDCYLNGSSIVDSYVSYIFDVAYNSSQIVSSPIDVHICQFIDQTLSNYGAQHSQNMYPGGTLQMSVHDHNG